MQLLIDCMQFFYINSRYHYDLDKFSFAPRIVNVWNSLSETVTSADTTDTFKRRLNKFWQHQDILYDYKVELTVVRKRSQIMRMITL